MSEDAAMQLTAPNLTKDRGSRVRGLSDRDWLRAIIAGVAPNGRSLLVMPHKELAGLADADVAAIVAFFKTVHTQRTIT